MSSTLLINYSTITQVIAKWVAENDSEHILRVLKDARVPAGPILSIADIAKEEQYQQRGMFETVTPPGSADDSGKLVVGQWGASALFAAFCEHALVLLEYRVPCHPIIQTSTCSGRAGNGSGAHRHPRQVVLGGAGAGPTHPCRSPGRVGPDSW